MSSPHIDWDSGKEMFVAWDEACMPIGYYDTREEAEREFEEYCAHLFPPSEYPEMHKGKPDVRNDSDRSDQLFVLNCMLFMLKAERLPTRIDVAFVLHSQLRLTLV